MFFTFAAILAICAVPAKSDEVGPFAATPYKIGVFVLHAEEDAELAETLSVRCRALIGELWTLQVVFSDSPPGEDAFDAFDQIVVAEFQDFGSRFEIESFDTRIRRTGPRQGYAVDDPAKRGDRLVGALFDVFRPIGRLDRATQRTATLQLQGSEIFRPTGAAPFDVPVPGGVLVPFLRSLDREDRILAVTPIPWTVLIAEEVDPVTRLLRCRIESGLPNPFGARFRGRSEVFAQSVTPSAIPTVLRLRPKHDVPISTTLPPYDVFETISDEPKPRRLGRTAADGTFVLEPVEGRTVRNVVIRNGRTLVARFPIVQGWEIECDIPISDDDVRLEAEAALLGIQEELIDVTARREILTRREKKYREAGDLKMAGEMRNELARLKDGERFLIEVEQARLRFQSADPVVRRRLERLFRETEEAIRK